MHCPPQKHKAKLCCVWLCNTETTNYSATPDRSNRRTAGRRAAHAQRPAAGRVVELDQQQEGLLGERGEHEVARLRVARAGLLQPQVHGGGRRGRARHPALRARSGQASSADERLCAVPHQPAHYVGWHHQLQPSTARRACTHSYGLLEHLKPCFTDVRSKVWQEAFQMVWQVLMNAACCLVKRKSCETELRVYYICACRRSKHGLRQ